MTREYYPNVVIVPCILERRGVATFIVPAFRPKPMFRFQCCEVGWKPEPKKEGRVSSDTE